MIAREAPERPSGIHPSGRLGRFLPEGILLAGTAALLLVARGRWITTISDPGIWYSDLESLSRGGRLMETVGVPYGPLSVAILHLACRVFGYRVATVSGVTFAFGLAALFLLLAFSARFLRRSERLVLAALAVGYLLWVPGKAALVYPYAPAVPIGLTLVLLSLRLRAGVSRFPAGLVAAAGVVAGLAYLTKQEMGVAAVAGLVAAGIPRIRSAHEIRRVCVALAVFLLVVAAGYAWWFRGMPFLEAARGNLLWPFARIPKAWGPQYAGVTGYDQPIRSLLQMLRAGALLAAIGAGAAAGWALFLREPRVARRAAAVLFVSLAGVLLVRPRGGSLLSAAPVIAGVALLAALVAARARGAVRSRTTALLSLAAASAPLLYRVGLRGWGESPFAGLGYTLVLPLFVWVVAEGALWAYRGRVIAARVFLRTAAPIAAAIVIAMGIPRLSRQRGWPVPVQAVRFARGTVYAPPAWAAALRDAASAVESGSPADAPVLFLPETHGLDFLIDRRSAAFVNKLDVAFRVEDGLLSRLRSDPPAVVVWFHEDDWPFGTEGFGSTYGTRLRSWLESRYAPALQSSGGVAFTLYRPRQEPAIESASPVDGR